MAYIEAHLTISALLRERVREDGDKVFCRWKDRHITYAELDRGVDRTALGLLGLGIRRGHRVALMLPHHPDHIAVLLALLRLGVVIVPLNPQLRGSGLTYVLQHAKPTAVVASPLYAEQLLPAAADMASALMTIWHEAIPTEDTTGKLLPTPLPHEGSVAVATQEIHARLLAQAEQAARAGDVVAICYTSGTTGPPKGVMITDKMCRCAATSSQLISGIDAGDVPLFWEPMYHMFGIEVLVLALMKPVTLAMVERFSASQFWQWARDYGATHIHYVGGVLQLLLKQSPSTDDRNHRVRVAWGGGCPTPVWRPFEQRFGISMRDSFGMTETSALNIINTEGVPGALGRPLPYFDARVVDDAGNDVPRNTVGELLIRGKEHGLITPGYFDGESMGDFSHASQKTDDWFATGDLVKVDEHGLYHFFSRKKDCVRRRGENVSAWEVERIVNEHPDVEESALVAVENEFGDEDLKLFVKLVPSAHPDPEGLVHWCMPRMARFQVPRFIAYIDEFPKTSTQRIRKHELNRNTDDCWDANRSVASAN